MRGCAPMTWLTMPDDDRAALKKLLRFIGVLMAAVVVITTYWVLRENQRADQLAPWTALIETYMPPDNVRAARDAHASDTRFAGSAAARIKRHVIPIDLKSRRVDPLYFEMPANLRSSTPDDVQTLVWLDWNEEIVGKYNNGVPARVHVCDVTVLDKTSLRVIAQRTFRGEPPPKEISTSSTSQGIGGRPNRQIVQYLAGMAGNW
jgi:hypothetical protein